MKRILVILFFLTVRLVQSEGAVTTPHTVVETNDPQDILSYVKEGTLVIFDIYNTLFETAQQLGSEQWADWWVSKLIAQGVPLKEAKRVISPRWNEILRMTEMKPVDSSMQTLVRALQRQEIPVIGITSKDPEISHVILQQLQSVDVSFPLIYALNPNQPVVFDQSPMHYEKGVLFCGEQISLGEGLLKLLDKTKYYPTQIVFVSHRWEQINDLAQYVRVRGLPYVGIRYSGADKSVAAFNPMIAEVQAQYLHKILSNEASIVLQPSRSFLDFFDHFWD